MAESITCESTASMISELEERHRVPEGFLDNKCSDEHVLTISTILTSWKVVASHLELTDQQIEDINNDFRTEKERRLNCLKEWKQYYGFKATYRKLLQALLKSGHRNTADEICYKLMSSQAESPGTLHYLSPPAIAPVKSIEKPDSNDLNQRLQRLEALHQQVAEEIQELRIAICKCPPPKKVCFFFFF